jgi:hypothetical protein
MSLFSTSSKYVNKAKKESRKRKKEEMTGTIKTPFQLFLRRSPYFG